MAGFKCLDEIIKKATSFYPEDRFESVDELKKDLDMLSQKEVKPNLFQRIKQWLVGGGFVAPPAENYSRVVASHGEQNIEFVSAPDEDYNDFVGAPDNDYSEFSGAPDDTPAINPAKNNAAYVSEIELILELKKRLEGTGGNEYIVSTAVREIKDSLKNSEYTITDAIKLVEEYKKFKHENAYILACAVRETIGALKKQKIKKYTVENIISAIKTYSPVNAGDCYNMAVSVRCLLDL